ncbi:MAG: methyltransferase domain-containing protein [Chloroherpetonaceae bacterium]|nr:methyltransferase domain-containing protein [Chloroherpetonaceae bacterium]
MSKNQASAAQNFLAEAQPSPETLSYEWFSAWFSSPIYLKLYEHRNFKEAEETVEMILRRTGLKETQPKPKVLDIACGAGRHAVAFAERGCDVVASDLSSFMLQEAKRVAEKHSVRLTFLQQDMRALTAEEEYDLVVQLFTSFGYFDNSEDDRRVVQNVRRALRQGGIYVLDFFNAEKVRQSYKPLTQRVVDGMLICEERKIVGDRIKKTVTVSENGNLKRFTESVRLYTATELAEMLTQAGFKVREILGNYDGSPFDAAQSPRAILFAEKVK